MKMGYTIAESHMHSMHCIWNVGQAIENVSVGKIKKGKRPFVCDNSFTALEKQSFPLIY
jgi:hypothetical protein